MDRAKAEIEADEFEYVDDYNDGLVDVWVRNFVAGFDWKFVATVPKEGWLEAARKIWAEQE